MAGPEKSAIQYIRRGPFKVPSWIGRARGFRLFQCRRGSSYLKVVFPCAMSAAS